MNATQHAGPEKDRFYVVVGEAIRAARMHAGMSISMLSKACGLNQNTLGHIEDGSTCSLFIIAKVAEALDMTIDELVPLEALR